MTGPHSLDEAAGLGHVTAMLRRLPDVPDGAQERVVAAAFVHRRRLRRQRAWLVSAAALTLAAGAGAGGTLLYRAMIAPTSVPQSFRTAKTVDAPAAPIATGDGRLAALGAHDDAPVAMPFELRRPNARRVAVVGDFDDWSPTAAPMTRGPGGTWTTTVALAPGRHAYAFVVDDTIWVPDPRAERVRDPDYGRDHSVVVVGRP